MRPLAVAMALVLMVTGCARSVQDRITDAKSLYTSTYEIAEAIDDAKPFEPDARRIIGRAFLAVEVQIDAADLSLASGRTTEAEVWIDQAAAGLGQINARLMEATNE